MDHELTPAELTIANRSRRFLRIGAVTLFTMMPLSWFVGARTTLVYGILVAPLLLTVLLTTHARCPRCRSTVVWLYLATGAHSVDLRCPHCGASLNEIR